MRWVKRNFSLNPFSAFSMLSAAFFCASFSPLVAALVQDLAGWRASFLCLSACALVVLLLCLRFLGETRQEAPEGSAAPARLLAGYALLLGSRDFLGYALSGAFAMSAWYAFVAGAPYVLSTLLFATMGAVVKHVSAELPTPMVVFFRKPSDADLEASRSVPAPAPAH